MFISLGAKEEAITINIIYFPQKALLLEPWVQGSIHSGGRCLLCWVSEEWRRAEQPQRETSQSLQLSGLLQDGVPMTGETVEHLQVSLALPHRTKWQVRAQAVTCLKSSQTKALKHRCQVELAVT